MTRMGGRANGGRSAGWLRALGAAALAVVAGCAAMVEEASLGPAPVEVQTGPVSLVPFLSLSQGMLTARRDDAGMPLPSTGMQPLRLIRPVAAAARGAVVYVADAGQASLYRVDPATALYARVAGVNAPEGVRIEIGPDGTLLVVDPVSREITRLLPGGRRLAPVGAASSELGQPVDIALDEFRGRVIVADGVYRQLLAFSASGQAFAILPLGGDGRLQVRALSHVAVGPRHLYLADPQCACVLVAAVDGPLTGQLAGPGFDAITGMTADRVGRLYVADGQAQEIRVYVDARPLQTFSYRSLMVSQVSDLHYADGVLWIVDPVGAKVEARRVVARGVAASSRRSF